MSQSLRDAQDEGLIVRNIESLHVVAMDLRAQLPLHIAMLVSAAEAHGCQCSVERWKHCASIRLVEPPEFIARQLRRLREFQEWRYPLQGLHYFTALISSRTAAV